MEDLLYNKYKDYVYLKLTNAYKFNVDILIMNTDRNNEKKIHERKHLDQFLKACNCVPAGLIEESDPLDFLIHYDQSILGIEHTEYFEKDKSGYAFSKKDESLQSRVEISVSPHCDKIGLPPTFVNILWRPNCPLTSSRVKPLIHDIVELISIHMPEKEGKNISLRSRNFKKDEFPNELIGLYIYRSAKIDSTSVNVTRGAWEIPIKIDELKNIITEKEKKLHLYRDKCDEVWLLIVAEGINPSSIAILDSSVYNYSFNLQFDRIFFFDLHNNYKVTELKIKKL